MIAENAEREERGVVATSRARRTSTTSSTCFDIEPNVVPPLPAIDADSDDDFNGTANYEKKGTFTARLTAVVVDTLPNGNLVVSGRREIRIDHETKLIEFSGIVRRYDIRPTTRCSRSSSPTREVFYRGNGPLTRQHEPQRPRAAWSTTPSPGSGPSEREARRS